MHLINAGDSDYEDDEENVALGNVAMEESKEAKGDSVRNDFSMAAESTVPVSNDNRLDPGIIRVGSNRFQVNVSMDDVETIKQRCES